MRELRSLKNSPVVTNRQLVGAMLATATRVDKVLDERMVGLQAFAIAVAMQPGFDAKRLAEDFASILDRQFNSAAEVPADLRDMSCALAMAAAHRT